VRFAHPRCTAWPPPARHHESCRRACGSTAAGLPRPLPRRPAFGAGASAAGAPHRTYRCIRGRANSRLRRLQAPSGPQRPPSRSDDSLEPRRTAGDGGRIVVERLHREAERRAGKALLRRRSPNDRAQMKGQPPVIHVSIGRIECGPPRSPPRRRGPRARRQPKGWRITCAAEGATMSNYLAIATVTQRSPKSCATRVQSAAARHRTGPRPPEVPQGGAALARGPIVPLPVSPQRGTAQRGPARPERRPATWSSGGRRARPALYRVVYGDENTLEPPADARAEVGVQPAHTARPDSGDDPERRGQSGGSLTSRPGGRIRAGEITLLDLSIDE